MQISAVDPRDQTWEILHARYRVYFHDVDGTSYEYEVGDADVDEVLRWAEGIRDGRSFVLYVRVAQDGVGLVRLLGRDPNEDRAAGISEPI